MNIQNNKYVINLDVDGGDNAPSSVLNGAELYLKDNQDVSFNLYGRKSIIDVHIKNLPLLFNSSNTIECQGVIDGNLKPTEAMKKEFRHSSLAKSISSLKNQSLEATVSSGNTGAMMAYSKVFLRTVENISRPAIASLFPSKNHPVCFLDLGANSECDEKNLYDFAIMGSIYYQILFPESACKVSLLNIGSEELKGNAVIQKTHELLKNSKSINYNGFIEANNITDTENHIIVTDGFTGNIALKTAEGISKFITDSLKKHLLSNSFSKILTFFIKPNLKSFKNAIDPRNFNGGILLGIDGVVIKSHGNADEYAFRNAIGFAVKCLESNLLNKIKDNAR